MSTAALSNSITLPVSADPDDIRWALHRLDLAAPAFRALHALGLSDHVTFRPGGATWRLEEDRGHVDVDIDIDIDARVEPGGEDRSFLSITTRFDVTDERARARLLDAWAVVDPLARRLAQRAALAVKEYAEDDVVRYAVPGAAA